MVEGVDGLLRDKTRPPGIAPLEAALIDKVVALTLEPPVHEATHWTVRAMAKAVGIAASSVVKIWHDHGLQLRCKDNIAVAGVPEHGNARLAGHWGHSTFRRRISCRPI